MILNEKAYKFLKWVSMVIIPAIATFYFMIAEAVGLPYADEVTKIAVAVETLLGTILGVSTKYYNKSQLNPTSEE